MDIEITEIEEEAEAEGMPGPETVVLHRKSLTEELPPPFLWESRSVFRWIRRRILAFS